MAIEKQKSLSLTLFLEAKSFFLCFHTLCLQQRRVEEDGKEPQENHERGQQRGSGMGDAHEPPYNGGDRAR